MIKRIIVEGSDQQGKTTLVHELIKRLNWTAVHFGKPPEDFNFFTDYITESSVISDRNFLSEIVYSRVAKRDCKIHNVDLLQKALKDYGTILILCDRGESFVFDKTRHEDYTQFQIAQATSYYREEFAKLKIKKYIYNPNCLGHESVLDMIIDLINAST